MNFIQEQLGHASLDTTAVYLRRIAPAERLDRIAGHTWYDVTGPAAGSSGRGEIACR